MMEKKIYLVAGLGKTGHSIANYLQRRNQPFAVFDTRHQLDITHFHNEYPDVDVFLGELPSSLYQQLIAIITSPGIALDEPFLQEAMRRHIPVFGDIECLAREVNSPIIAITGTNGKSTVTSLVGEMAIAAGFSAAVAGNIGTPVLDILDNGEQYDLWVLELSSFQLDLTTSLAPIAATILNISADHLDRHHSLQAYIDAKQRIYHQAQCCVFNRDDKKTIPVQNQLFMTSFGLDEPQPGHWGIRTVAGVSYLCYGQEQVLATEELAIKGQHNWQNALAACAVASASGIKKEQMVNVLKTFKGLPHRCQWVRTLDEVAWINDSKGTNVGATISAITGIGSAMPGKIVLIAGGQGKGADFTQLRTPVTDFVRSVVLIGEDARLIEKALEGSVPLSHSLTLSDAVARARSQAVPGDVVLLSPACASFDMFNDFNHRGELYSALVEQL